MLYVALFFLFLATAIFWLFRDPVFIGATIFCVIGSIISKIISSYTGLSFDDSFDVFIIILGALCSIIYVIITIYEIISKIRKGKNIFDWYRNI